ncbi:MAG: HD domain-containing protein [Dehalococcoidia bacterium]|nr:HD domain-containing protein [Dehalococcoidia bacterium]
MRRAHIADPLIQGAVLARDLRAPSGEVLARAGMTMTPRGTRALGAHGVDLCFVEDGASTGVHAAPIVDAAQADAPLLGALREACAVVWRLAEGAAGRPTSRAVQDLRAMPIIGALDTSGAMDALRAAVAGFVVRAAQHDASAGFLTERLRADDLFGHSAGVAALTVRIGADIGFQEADLASAALAALTHDLGLLMVTEDIRQTPAEQRTPAQQRRYEDHTILGRALLAGLEHRQPALPLVALEHHEEQSGGGYPAGITGGNRLLRGASASASARPIALISEVVAVADRYERLVSPAPGKAALSPAAARRVLSQEAGACLNAEVVGRFLDLFPQWPVGTEVVFAGGPLDGARGLVVALDPSMADRPRVRLFADRHGQPVDPVEVALAREPEFAIAVADGQAA